MASGSPSRGTLQQTVLAELGLRVIDADEAGALMDFVAHAVAEALDMPAVGIFEMEGQDLVLRAGLGWLEGAIGQAVLPVEEPQMAAVLASSEPVVLDGRVPDGLQAVGGGAGFAVRLGGAGEPAGVLAAYAVERRDFDSETRTFLGAVAAVLAGALEQIRTKQALRESEARARAVLETTVDGVITIDEQGVVESFNPAAERIFGYPAGEVVGRNVTLLMPTPYHAEHDGYIQAYHETGRRKIIGIGREVVGRRKDGSTFPMDLAVSEVHLPDRLIFTGFVRDISERRALEQEVLRIAEDERRRIGQDLHDGLGQMLTGTALIARSVARRLDRGESPEAEAREVVGLIKEADAYARQLARGLVPVELEADGLRAALDQLAANAERFFGIGCSVESFGDHPTALSSTALTHLFRIAQEAVSNAVRHGRADRLAIALAVGAEHLRLRVEDNGQGFPDPFYTDPEALPPDAAAPVRPGDNRGMGVRIMHYRARVLGGRLDIRPGAERGTVVTCTVPLWHTSSPTAEGDLP